jgi:hypothetical protein
VVLELLAPDRGPDDVSHLVVVGSIPQRPAQIGLVERKQACPQPPVRGQADPVAVGAERLGDGIDEPDPAAAVGEPVDPRRG